MSWDQLFDDPLPLPGGEAHTLREAAAYVVSLPKKVVAHEKWQTAMLVLLQAAERRGPVMHARIGMLQALNMNKPPAPLRPAGTDPKWGRRGLARDR